ncbi:MAG: DNA pilot protein [Microviridae sp.]|nr:MAG: DNA pilot protein [Microviridae sp.]
MLVVLMSMIFGMLSRMLVVNLKTPTLQTCKTMGNFFKNVANAFASSNPIGTGVGLAFNAIGSAFQNGSNKHRQEEAFSQQEKMQALQNAYNTNMWHMTNEYNSPKNQMRLLKEAGLNPNLIYGQMSDIGASPMQTGSGAAPGFAHMSNVMESANPLTMAQARLANAQADKLDIETTREYTFSKFDEQLLSGRVEYQSISITGQKVLNELNDQQRKQIYQLTKNAEKQEVTLDRQNELLEYDVLMKIIDHNFYQQFKGAELTKLQYEARLVGMSVETFMEGFYSMLALNSSKIKLNDAERETATKKSGMLESLGLNYDAERQIININADIAEDFARLKAIMELVNMGTSSIADLGNIVAKWKIGNQKKPLNVKNETHQSSYRDDFGGRHSVTRTYRHYE